MNNNEIVKNETNKFWSSNIRKLHFDMLNNSIRFELEVFSNDKLNLHILELRNVSSYYFINNFGEKRKEFLVSDELDDILEFTSIEFINDENANVKLETNKEWSNNNFNSKPKLVIDIGNRFLFIETEFAIVDYIEYTIYS